MDFKAFTEKAKQMAQDAANKVKKVADQAVEKTAQSFAKTGIFIKENEEQTKQEQLAELIKNNKKIIIIFWKQESEFFRKALVMFPVLFTKWWAHNFKLKLYPLDEEESVSKDYKVEDLPALIIFKEGEVSETVEWAEEVMKIVKKLSLEVEWVANNIQEKEENSDKTKNNSKTENNIEEKEETKEVNEEKTEDKKSENK